MPLYEYQCEACGQRFEAIQKFSDAPLESCRKCGKGPVAKLQSSPAFQFKGSGWYITDYAKKSSSEASSATKTDTKSEAKSESKSETKTETKTEAKSDPKPA
ncbi:MAG: FmdB family zinc ribbon protein [Vicinamibacterales bacterium]